ncbi:hypothetical protein BH09PAT3_BH09PAT3_5440 [soil metagenome]
MKNQVSRRMQAKQTNSMYAIDPPMKHYVYVKKSFPGAFL